MNRRDVLKSAVLGVSALAMDGVRAAPAKTGLAARLQALEHAHGGHLGVAVMDTASGRVAGHRLNERFLMCSTFKLLLAGAVLARVDRGEERLDRRIVVKPGDLLKYAPITHKHIGPPGITVAELCRAAVTVSDNTAANLLLRTLGGPAGWTAFARSLGDRVSRLDHYEPELNRFVPGNPSNTTTPAAAVGAMHRLLLGNALSAASRERLLGWLRASTTGGERLRAGLPSGWIIGDKTGSGFRGEANDLAIIWPPQRPPLLVAAYYLPPRVDDSLGPPVLAAVGRIVASA